MSELCIQSGCTESNAVVCDLKILSHSKVFDLQIVHSFSHSIHSITFRLRIYLLKTYDFYVLITIGLFSKHSYKKLRRSYDRVTLCFQFFFVSFYINKILIILRIKSSEIYNFNLIL